MTDEWPPPGTVASSEWGRVDAEGGVHVRTPTGERQVGSWQAAEPEAGLAFFRLRFDDLETQVSLLEQRLASGAVGVEDAAATAKRLGAEVEQAQAVGDLAGLAARLDGVQGIVAERRAQRRAERAEALTAAKTDKERIVGEAERVAASTDWRHGADRLRALLEEWKALPRLDRPTDDALWRRFSTARTTYTRHRKAHFSEQAGRRDEARVAKETLVREAEEIAGSTEWGPTAGRYRDLMRRWKAAGPAPRDAEEALWQRFRAAQDRFFAARTETFAARDAEENAALVAKEALLAEAEAIMPVRDLAAARQALRSVHDRWESAGRVPKDAVRGLDLRLRRVEDAVREAEHSQWRRTDPAARARAQDSVDQLRATIARLENDLAAARAAGDDTAAGAAEDALTARRSWLRQAEQALAEFSSS